MPNIYCLGPSGTFSFSAAETFAKRHSAAVKSLNSIEEVFLNLLKDESAFGVLPIENTIGGVVGVHQDLLVKYCQNHSIRIASEVDYEVKFGLLANTKDLSEVEFVYAHPHAYEQCQLFKMDSLAQAQLIFTKSTILAAQEFIENVNKNKIAAIVPQSYIIKSQELTEYHFSKEMPEGIQDSANNITRFFIIKRQPEFENDFNRHKTSLFIETIVDESALLFNILAPFAHLKLNLSFLHSKSNPKIPWFYNFFIDFSNKPEYPEDSELLIKLLERQEHIKITILGTYNSKVNNNG